MEQAREPYIKQIFVCTNQRDDGSSCCAGQGGEMVFRQLRELAKERKLHPAIRVAQAKCLGQCAKGGNVMIYPEKIWYHNVSLGDVPALADKYLKE